jgi:hypothetical protein
VSSVVRVVLNGFNSKEELLMNGYSFVSLLMIACGALLGISLGIFAYGADFWISTGIGCGLAGCVAISEISPMFD